MAIWMNIIDTYINYWEPFLFVVAALLFLVYYMGNSLHSKKLYRGSLFFVGVSAGMFAGLAIGVLFVFFRKVM